MIYTLIFVIGLIVALYCHNISMISETAYIISLFALIVFFIIAETINIMRKPIYCAKGKVVGKKIESYKGNISYHLDFLLADKSIIRSLEVTKKQYRSVDKYDIADFIYQGPYIWSIQKQGTQKAVLDTVVTREMLAKAKPQPLNFNGDTREYDKANAQYKKYVKNKRKKRRLMPHYFAGLAIIILQSVFFIYMLGEEIFAIVVSHAIVFSVLHSVAALMIRKNQSDNWVWQLYNTPFILFFFLLGRVLFIQ